MIGQLDKLNKLQKTFVYGSKSHVPDYYIDASNRKFKIVTDYLGSVRLIVSSTGVVSEVMEHDEFGRVLQDTNPGLTPFGFAGGLYDYKTSLVRFGARDYDAETGRWLSKDPIRFNGGDANLYGYVLQDPVNLIDPTGLIFTGQAFVPSPIYSPVSPGLLPNTGTLNKVPSMLQKMIFLLNKPITPENEGRILKDFLDNVIHHKNNEYNNLNCPRT